MGEVYRAFDSRFGRHVAVKVLRAAEATDSDLLRRFEVETHAVAALNHPNIVTVHDAGVHDGVPFIVSELLDGETLRSRLTRAAAEDAAGFPLDAVIALMTQVAEGLSAAHAAGIVHRDLKPENVFITHDGRVKILDFGLAKFSAGAESPLTLPGVTMRTVGYMAPEQLRGQAVDARADVFAFGVMLYEVITGRHPFRGASQVDTMTALLHADPPPVSALRPAVPAAFIEIVRGCLEKVANRRYASASDVLKEFQGSAATLTGGETPTHRRRRSAAAVLLLTSAVVLPAFAGTLIYRSMHREGATTATVDASDRVGTASVATAAGARRRHRGTTGGAFQRRAAYHAGGDRPDRRTMA
jgi:eukaryotic-like serine/threonine-protein kinase